MEMFNIIFKTFFFYFFVIICYRIMGKREIGQLGIIDLIVSILIAELIAISIENKNDPIMYTIVPIVLLVIMELIFGYVSLKSRKLRVFLDGKPSLIICNGKVNYNEMVKQRYSLDNLLLSLRQQSIKDISEIEYAFLENNGKLSVFKYNFLRTSTSYPMPIIIDGSLQKNALKFIHKNETWLNQKLDDKNLIIDDVFYCFYKSKKLFIIKKTEVKGN